MRWKACIGAAIGLAAALTAWPAAAWPTPDFLSIQATYAAIKGTFVRNGVRSKLVHIPNVRPMDVLFKVEAEDGRTHIVITAFVSVTREYRLRWALPSGDIECQMRVVGGGGFWSERYLEPGSDNVVCQQMIQVLMPN